MFYRQWNKRINKFILSLGFKRCDLDPCLYYANRNGQIMLICVYVDDILIAGGEEFIKLTRQRFCNKFEMKDLGELRRYLNIRVTRTAEYIRIDQQAYPEKILKKY
jgi:hypothetical protein